MYSYVSASGSQLLLHSDWRGTAARSKEVFDVDPEFDRSQPPGQAQIAHMLHQTGVWCHLIRGHHTNLSLSNDTAKQCEQSTDTY